MMRSVRWSRLLLRWAKVLSGRSYYHQPQRLGMLFRPGELAGYFNDLTTKTSWSGLVDDQGIPVNILADGRRVYFAKTIAQKALGHWDKWLLTHNAADREAFLMLCRWLLAWQDARGGWPVLSELGLSAQSPYSAMTQGECISAFVRAWMLTEDRGFADGARKAFNILRTPVDEGGPAVFEGKCLFLEEIPSVPRSSILNGWIFALFGLYDFSLTFDDETARNLLELSLDTLKEHLQDYDTGYWSRYDRLGNLASPFYHDLHIHQLTALSMIHHDPIFVQFRDRFTRYRQSLMKRSKALGIKALQKLRKPAEVIVIK